MMLPTTAMLRYVLLLLILLKSFSMVTKERKKVSNIQTNSLTGEEIKSVIQSYKDTYKYCYKNFKMQRWNCPVPKAIENTNSPVSLTKSYKAATKETAYVFAMMSASLMYNILRACQQGVNPKCPCVPSPRLANNNEDKKTRDKKDDCVENLYYAIRRTKKIMKIYDYKQVTHDERRKFNLENVHAGIQVISRRLEKICKCHGVSGQCITKTCWQSANKRSLEESSRDLMHLHKKAKKYKKSPKVNKKHLIVDSSKGNNIAREFSRAKQNSTSLVYLTESPNYCKANKRLGIAGTLNRECHHDDNSCQHLCTSCGHRKHSFVKTNNKAQCKCEFKWCCAVECQVCVQKTIYAKCTNI